MKLTPNSMIYLNFLQIFACFVAFSTPALAQDAARPAPEIATGKGAVSKAMGTDFMIVTANPHATKAGYEILKNGGSATDAAIAAQLVLGLVEPQSSGLGGGAFVLHYDAKTGELNSYDGRETAPNLAGPFLFQQNGQAMGFYDAVVGGRAVGVPGIPALLKDMHEAHGKLTWMELFDDAITLAEEGFTVSPRLAKSIAASAERLKTYPQTAAYFLPNGQALKQGERITNPAYAETLKEYRFYGPSKFYRGQFAKDIVQTVQNIAENPGLLTTQDFESYTVKKRDPVCGPYNSYIICSMGEPSSGGLTLLQILGLLEHFDIPNTPKGWSIIAQASALAFADRNAYMADPDFVSTPNIALIDPEYLKSRAALIDPANPLTEYKAGTPVDWDGPLYKTGVTFPEYGTSHISVIDKAGNIVSMTTTIEGAFGSHVMTNGFLLNNQLTDFSFNPFVTTRHPVGASGGCSHERDPEKAISRADESADPRCWYQPLADRGDDRRTFVANMVEAGKRPRSSMAPTIVFDQTGAPILVIGSAGGSRIIGYVLQQILSALEWGIPLDKALAKPHILARDANIEVEDVALSARFQAEGLKAQTKELNSGLTAIRIQGDNYKGAADPRREGTALGD